MILIKRYPNRKLYNTATKQYITLDGLAGIVRDGDEIQVIDHVSGEDLTSFTLTQVILEQEKKQTGFLTNYPLADLIRSGSEHLSALQRGIFSHSFWRQIDEEIRQRVQSLIHKGELSLSEGELLIEKLVNQGKLLREENRKEGSIDTLTLEDLEDYLRQNQIPTQKDLETLSTQIDMLAEKIEQITLFRS